MGGFYKIIVGTTKLTLKNINLTSLIEVEQVINTRSLVYVDNDLDNQIISPAHYLSINIKEGTPVLTVKNDDEKLISIIMWKR